MPKGVAKNPDQDKRKQNGNKPKDEEDKRVSLGLYCMKKNKAMLREKLLPVIKKLDK